MGLCWTNKQVQTCPVLILGTAGSGKSTFVKQMRFLHPTQSLLDLDTFRPIILENIRSGLSELAQIAEKQEFELDPANRKCARRIQQNHESGGEFDETLERAAKSLWEDEGIQRAWNMVNHNIYCTHLGYMMDKISSFRDPAYQLTKEDVLRARQRTTGFTVTDIQDGERLWKFVDVGGQQIERQKWSELFNSDKYVAYIFFVALDDYNVLSSERPDATRLRVSLSVFGETVKTLSEITDICPLVFFNKTDLFTEKLKSESGWNDFQRIFPEYSGGRVIEEAGEHIFLQFRKEIDNKRRLQGYFTCAMDSEMMKTIFDAISKYVQDLAMATSGLDF